MSQAAMFDMDEGRERRDEGMRRVAMATPFEPWASNCDRAIAFLAGIGIRFTADDLRAEVGDPPKPNAFGGRLLHAAESGLIEWTGELEQSERPESRGRWLKIWRGLGAA